MTLLQGTRRALLGSTAVAFLPTAVANLQAWFKSDVGLFQESTFVTASGDDDPVGGWRDQSGNGNDVIQATSSLKWTLRLDEINGLPALQNDGDDFIANVTTALGFSGTDKPLATFCVAKVTDTAANRVIFSIGNSGTNTQFYEILTNATPEYSEIKRDDASVLKAHDDGTPQTINYVLWTILNNGTQSTMRVDGALIGSADVDLDVGASTFDQFAIGTVLRVAASANWVGFLAEIAVVQDDISAADLALMETYFANRYGISLP